MDPQENLKFPKMDEDLKFKISIVPFHVSEMPWFCTSFGQERQKSEYEVFLTSPFSLWSHWCNTRSCWKLSSFPLRTWTTWEREGTCAQNAPLDLYSLQPSTLLFLSSCGGLRASIFPSAWLSPLAPSPSSLGHSLSFSSFEHLAFFPNALFLPSLLLLSIVFCLSLAGLPLPGHLPHELFLWALYCITQHLSPRHTHNSEFCSVFLSSSHTLNFCRSIGAKFNWRILLCTISIALFPILKKHTHMEKYAGSESSRTYHAGLLSSGVN